MADWQDFWNDHIDSSRIGFLGRKLERMERKLDILLKQLNIEIPDEPVSPDMNHVKVLIDQGNVIEAIKVYRQQFGGSLAEAKTAVEELARGGKR
jgi:ribosomal protein L7/L12